MSTTGIGPLLRRRFRPGECYRFWETHSPGFRRPERDLSPDDATPQIKASLNEAFSAALTKGRTPVIKLTGWPRIGFLLKAFPSSRFVHVVRDGRAVAASLLKVDFWRGQDGPENWRFGPLSPEDQDQWNRSGESPVVLAGLQWKILTGAVELTKGLVPSSRFCEIRYEDLCADPEESLEQVLEFCSLDWTSQVRGHLVEHPFVSTNTKWPEDIAPEDQPGLQEAVAPALLKYGYS